MRNNIIITGLLLLTSCGPINVDHRVKGEVKVVLDLNQVEKYFRIVCADEHPDDVAMQDRCVAYKVNDFISKLNITPSQYTPPSDSLADEYSPPLACPSPSPSPTSSP